MNAVEIIAIGNELLLGDVLDTNTNWICQQITSLGGRVTRAAMIRDEVEDIANEIRDALARHPSLLILSGGLGPTDDDLTLRALASAMKVELQLHDDALRLVAAAYEKFVRAGHLATAELTDARRKMAFLPAGSRPLDNPVGAAPGVLVRNVGRSFLTDTTIVALPGVPSELKGIFQTSLQPVLREILGTGSAFQRAVIVNCGDESALAEALRAASASNPDVYIKSHAGCYGDDVKLKVTVQCSGGSGADPESLVDRAIADLARQLALRDITVDAIQ